MNENIDLTKILKDCPKGTVLYSTIYGDVILVEVQNSGRFPIKYRKRGGTCNSVTAQGLFSLEGGECVLFPSKDQRDWGKFTAPWLKKERFDPKTLHHYDRVVVRDRDIEHWRCSIFSHIVNDEYLCIGSCYKCCIPYNDDTKHLVGTNEDAPEFYRYWED